MELVLIFFGLLAVTSVAIFVVFQPRVMGPQRRALGAYNWCIFGIALLLCCMFTFLMHANYAIPDDQMFISRSDQRNLWLILAGGGSSVIVTLFFFFGWIARNFWIFKPPRLSRRPW